MHSPFEILGSPIHFSFWQIATLLFLGVVFLFIFLLTLEKPSRGYQYKIKASIMTRSENEFYKVLQSAVGTEYDIFPQIHLDTLLDYKVNGQSWIGALRHINQKSIDFVLCEKINTKPVLAIELDDLSHERQDRIKRDIEVERIFKETNFPLLRFKNNHLLTKETVFLEISKFLNKNTVV